MRSNAANIALRDVPSAPKIEFSTGWTGSETILDNEWWFTITKRLFRVTWHQDGYPDQSYVKLEAMIPNKGWSFITSKPSHEYGASTFDIWNQEDSRDLALEEMWKEMVQAATLTVRHL